MAQRTKLLLNDVLIRSRHRSTASRVFSSNSVPEFTPFRCARIRSMLVTMSVRRSIGTSEGIDRLCLCARPNVGSKLVAPCYVDIAANNLFKVSGHACVSKKITCEIWTEINEQIHVAVCSALFSNN
jgi:hypothetical protein